MKILLIDVNFRNSSTGKIIESIFNSVNSNGDIASVCYGRGEKIKKENIFKFGLDWETYLHAILTRLTGYTGYFSIISTIRLLRYIKIFQPDIVHIHELHAYFVNIVMVINYLKKNNIKTIWTFHCDHMYTGKCGYSFECEKWTENCGECPYLHDYPKSIFFDRTTSMLKKKKELFSDFENIRITTVSKWLADRVKRSFLHDKKLNIVFNGIDTNIFYRRESQKLREELGILPGEKMVLAVASGLMNEGKGGENVLKLANRMKGKNIRFVLVGVDNVDIKHPENTILIKRIKNQEKLAEFYSLANLFILCSKRETFSMPCAEALCCGTQVVGFKSGAPETVFKYPYAQFVEYDDFDKLSNLILDTIDKPLKQSEIIKYGNDNFSEEIMTQNYIKIYNEMIDI